MLTVGPAGPLKVAGPLGICPPCPSPLGGPSHVTFYQHDMTQESTCIHQIHISHGHVMFHQHDMTQHASTKSNSFLSILVQYTYPGACVYAHSYIELYLLIKTNKTLKFI